MAVDKEWLRDIYDKTGGHCRYCGKRLSIENHGNRNGHGGWAIDHSIPAAQGGTDHMNNLFPACYECNEDKADMRGDSYLRKKQEERKSTSSGSDCFVATAACGPEDFWIIQSLRAWRDVALVPSSVGRVFVRIYYSIGPFLANPVRHSAKARKFVTPVLRGLARRVGASN